MTTEGDAETSARSVLEDASATLFQVQKAVALLERAAELPIEASIGVSSNTSLDRLGLYLRRQALRTNVRLSVHQGNYDTLVDDVATFAAANLDYVLFAPFFDNLLPAFESQILAGLPDEVIATKEAEFAARCELAFAQGRGFRKIFILNFHRISPSPAPGGDRVSEVIARFNAILAVAAAEAPNAVAIGLSELVAAVGSAHAFDWRFYAQAKAPFASPLLNEIARRIALQTRGYGAYFYKALVFDCDNTLWGGVIGEDLVDGVKLSAYDYPGNVFWRVQQEAVALERAGVLICLCTKNNAADVDEMFDKHPDMPLKRDMIAARAVNWDDKPQNLIALSEELNIGLDSLVFIDDSSFECEAVRSRLPMVKTFQAPSNLSEYPRLMDEVKALFLSGDISAESRSKTQQYRQRAEAQQLRASFGSQEEYLASLDIRVQLSRNARASAPRIAELSQKSNQFNLTTRRYSEAEILATMDDPHADVYSLVVADKFGSAGLTGVVVIRRADEVAEVEAFLMSCRVIGRGVEFAIWSEIARDAEADGCRTMRAAYRRTAKNALVQDIYDRTGFDPVETSDAETLYSVALPAFTQNNSPWITLTND